MAQATTLTDLPPDILYSIFPYLSAADFLRFTNSTRALFHYREDPAFWHTLTRKTFRIPPQPLFQDTRWQRLYKKLFTQTRLYTWGDNKSGNLGHADPQLPPYGHHDPGLIQQMHTAQRGHTPASVMASRRRRASAYLVKSGWPRPAVVDEGVGIVADVQCGGWSTTILNSIGAIYIFGILDGMRLHARGISTLRRLEFPPAYPPTTKARYEPSTAIQQYSTGRSSVLGLADDGKVWMWEQDVGFQVRPVHVDLLQNKVERVVAGWDRNSMYIVGVGIVYWASVQDSDRIQGGRRETLPVHDAMLIESVTVPGTGYRRRKNEPDHNDSLGCRIGQVTNHVVLSGYIVFTTDLNKIFSYRTIFPMPALDVPEPVELTTFYGVLPDHPFQIRDVQGAFIRFAIFTDSGNILTGSEGFLNAFQHASTTSSEDHSLPLPSPAIIPSLQSKTIMSLAFGDHHFHALHANGTVTSYGQELARCGALGLGNRVDSTLRGVKVTPGGFGSGCLPDGEGRTVWFEPLMEKWLEDTSAKAEHVESKERLNMLNSGHEGAREAFANYFEKEGAKWERAGAGDGGMGAYFILKVAAAGWHSAALVLVDEEKAEKLRDAHVVKPPHPKLRDPSPAPSMQSNDSYEHIDSPGEQLINTVFSIYQWIWYLGRWFLGLGQRDAARQKAAEQARQQEHERDEEGTATYTWSNDPFPRLRLPDGSEMPGEVPLAE